MIVGVGVLMIIYVTFGGMRGTTWVQIVKAVLLIIGSFLITILVLAKFGFNLSELLGAAAEKSGKGQRSWSLGCSTARTWSARSTSCPSAWPWCSAPPAFRTS